MTTYNLNSGFGCTVKVDYVDPAGGFGGWFLLTMNHIGIAQATNNTDATTMSNRLTGTPAGNADQAGMHTSIKERLTQMFGTDTTVTWTVTLLQGITPAVLDDSY